jgi:hypothetical protein
VLVARVLLVDLCVLVVSIAVVAVLSLYTRYCTTVLPHWCATYTCLRTISCTIIACFVSTAANCYCINSPIAGARGAGNIVLVKSRNLDTTSYSGPGAGRFPTANSVVSDVARIARGMATPSFSFDKEWQLEGDFTSEFYTRITCKVSTAQYLAVHTVQFVELIILLVLLQFVLVAHCSAAYYWW